MISWMSFFTILGMLTTTYSSRLIGFFVFRNRTLSSKAERVMTAAPGCVLISVIAPSFVSDSLHEIIALGLTLLAASRLPMLPTVLIAVGSNGILGWLLSEGF